jgi:hypothetical protein
MRGEQVIGRFNINHERSSIISGTTKEVVRTVGYDIEWWLYRPDLTFVDPIYDVGSSGANGGRHWHGPHHIMVINATLTQGVTVQNDRGFYNTDILSITINMDVIDGSSLSGGESLPIPELKYLPSNPDAYMRDRIVFKNQVFTPKRILPKGIIIRLTLKSWSMILSSNSLLTTHHLMTKIIMLTKGYQDNGFSS